MPTAFSTNCTGCWPNDPGHPSAGRPPSGPPTLGRAPALGWRTSMTEPARYDSVVVGAGTAGSCAATVLARAGHTVLLVERVPFPGSKNMYGVVIYPRILDHLHPAWWESAPL